MKYLFLYITLLFSCLELSGQIISSIQLDKDTLDLGESSKVIYHLKIPHNVGVRLIDFSVFDSIESLIKMPNDTSTTPYYADIEWDAEFMHFDNKKLKLDPADLISSKEGLEFRDTFNCVFWDIGQFPIPQPEIVLDSAYQDVKVMNLQSDMVMVLPPLDIVNPDTTSAILDIKPIIEEETTYKDYLWLFYLWVGLLLLAGLVWYFWGRKRKLEAKEPEEEIIVPAHEIALSKLDELRQKKLWQAGHIKAYQSELTYIIREYLEKRYGVHALESTTDQIIRSLRSFDLKLDHKDSLRQILQIADLVKFAKAKPTDDIHESFLNKAESFIDETKIIELAHPENDNDDE